MLYLFKAKEKRFLDDLNRLEAKAKDPDFKGELNMTIWGLHQGEHAPENNHYCGTKACLAGWLAIVGRNGYRGKWKYREEQHWGHGVARLQPSRGLSFIDRAIENYGLSDSEAHRLFLSDLQWADTGRLSTLFEKIAEARALIAARNPQ